MARRIKEDAIVHQERIAKGAMTVFANKGIANTTMDDIAKEAGYGKATLYVYFKNKEDIVSFISLYSMRILRDSLKGAIEENGTSKDIFMGICNSIEKFYDEYPDFFRRTIKYIEINTRDDGSWLSQTYQVGEEINQIILDFLEKGARKGDLVQSDNYKETILNMWGMVPGIVELASEKEEYIRIAIATDKENFLKRGFENIYRVIAK